MARYTVLPTTPSLLHAMAVSALSPTVAHRFATATGQVVGAVLVFRDVPRNMRRSGPCATSSFYTRSLIESNIDALMTTDLSGIITYVNQQMMALTGCTRR